MADERFILAIGRIERALSRIEQIAISRENPADTALSERHARLKSETEAAVRELDNILAGAA